MATDVLYTDGVIAAREKYLLKDKLVKLCESGPEDALRAVTESGFGKGTEIVSVYDYEKLVAADEAAIDAFILEYSPSEAEKTYLLAPRDFHNLKALLKAQYTGADVGKMLAPQGIIPLRVLEQCVKNNDFSQLADELKEAAQQAAALFADADGTFVSGAEIGALFEKAQYKYLARLCKRKPLLKKLLSARADMTNILTALRSPDKETAEKFYLDGGKLPHNLLGEIFSEDSGRAESCLDGTAYAEFYKKCLDDRREGLPHTAAERETENYEVRFFAAKKYELVRNQPFLYYVFRRRAENADVRILFVCLLAGRKDYEIKARLRSV